MGFNFANEVEQVKSFHTILNEQGFGGCGPLITCFDADGNRLASVLCRFFGDWEDKQEAFKEMMMMIAVTQAQTIFFATDSWMAPAPEGWSPEDKSGRPFVPSEAPHKIESLNCIHFERKADNTADIVDVDTQLYLRSNQNVLYWVRTGYEQKFKGGQTGFIVELLNTMLTITEPPLDIIETGKHLTALGHHVGTWESTDPDSLLIYYPEGFGDGLEEFGYEELTT